MRTATFLLMIITIGLYSCVEQQASQPNYFVPIPQNLLDYGYFKTGTYWIYEDSVSHAIDSLYVVYDENTYGTISPQDRLNYTGKFGFCESYTNGSDPREMSSCFSIDMNFGFDRKGIPYKPHTGTIQRRVGPGTTLLMQDGASPGYSIPNWAFESTASFITFSGVYDSIKVLNTYYKNVLLYYDSKNQSEMSNRTKTFLGKNIGIVRKELLDSNQVWNLKRFHVIQ
jgi:hypothetical protein